MTNAVNLRQRIARRAEEHALDPPVSMLVTGDTHLSPRRDWLPEPLIAAASEVDVIIHTGDFCTENALQMFRDLGPLLAVRGNNEDGSIHASLPDLISIQVGRNRILVTHGHRELGPSANKAVQHAYSGTSGIVIFGHSHRPLWEEVNQTWFLNPGSPTMRRREPRCSFARLEVRRDDSFDALFTLFDV